MTSQNDVIVKCRQNDGTVLEDNIIVSYFVKFQVIDLRREAKAIIHLQNRLSVTISAQITTKT